MKRVNVHIERLVLRGAGETAPGLLAAALQQELQRVLAQVGAQAWKVNTHLARLPVGAVSLAEPSTPAEIGTRAGLRIGNSLVAMTGGRTHG